MKLTEEEIVQILNFIEESNFEHFELETTDLKLSVGKGERGKAGAERDNGISISHSQMPPKSPGEVGETGSKPGSEVPASTMRVSEDGLIPIKAPMLGTFYRRPAPGEPCCVEVGSFVKEDDTVCILEVLNIFHAIEAGVQGYISKVFVEDGKLVEYGETLFLVSGRPASEDSEIAKEGRPQSH